jgi:hypothetical protein
VYQSYESEIEKKQKTLNDEQKRIFNEKGGLEAEKTRLSLETSMPDEIEFSPRKTLKRPPRPPKILKSGPSMAKRRITKQKKIKLSNKKSNKPIKNPLKIKKEMAADTDNEISSEQTSHPEKPGQEPELASEEHAFD